MDITYDRISLINRLTQAFRSATSTRGSPKNILIDTINRLRETIKARNRAYHALKLANDELRTQRKGSLNITRPLQQRVDERTAELIKTQEESDRPQPRA